MKKVKGNIAIKQEQSSKKTKTTKQSDPTNRLEYGNKLGNKLVTKTNRLDLLPNL